MKGKKLMAMLMAGSLLLAGLTGCGGANAKGGGAAASADDYPNGPVTIICPWGVGGGADVISRKISEVAKNYFDQPIIVENHTGASGTIGMNEYGACYGYCCRDVCCAEQEAAGIGYSRSAG